MRSHRSTKRLNEIINKENTLLAKLFHKADVLQQLDTDITSLLPTTFAGKAKVANINRREVIIHITTAALLTRLRLQQRQVMQKINQRFSWAQIEKVTIKVRPEKIQKEALVRPKPNRSEQIALEVELAAEQCSDISLKESLSKLASHIRKPG
ncbi:DciA family protein [Oceanospirillum sanctuarii]|uniref:DciA family protein n=1 Tax=Oceanospirillum sanctuarii TaxID=1434821 RepID=UPI000A3CFB83|nr:DciA family protein [Oceanospirillum sanctuarii]